MGNLAILEIGEGDFEKGFPVTLRIGTDGNPHTIVIPGHLPPAPMIPKRYECWKSSYRDRGVASYRKLEPIQGQKTHISIIDSANVLQESINEWLNSGNRQFTSIRDKLLETLSQKNGKTRFIIQTDDIRLWRLPWHLWDVLDNYKVEVTFSRLTYEKGDLSPNSLKDKVRILVILGDSTDIDVQADLELLKQRLPDAYIFPLIATRRNQLSDELWGQDWDILFFAGHSSSEFEEEQGRLYINETENITIEDLKYALQKAINRGLRLAIFNSCDGLGLARDLASLQMPAIIVMRERIPDEAAQNFLEYFLEAFARNNKSLNDSVREARERLHGWEGKYPCASWLPVIFQNPAEEPLTWIGLRKRNIERKQLSISRILQTVVLTSVLVTGAVMGVRSLGFLQSWELQAFDSLMRQRTIEKPDSRILVVAATEKDFQQLQEPSVVSDRTVARLIERLKQYQPQVIGLHIHRDIPLKEERADLVKQMYQKDAPIAICRTRKHGESAKEGDNPPKDFPKNSFSFSDFAIDKDGVIRRHLLQMKPDASSPCQAEYAFSLRLALTYLEKVYNIKPPNKKEFLQIGDVVFRALENHAGGYQNLDPKEDLGGYQLLLNYRSYRDFSDIAETVNFVDVLDEIKDLSYVRGRIVIIGYGDDKTPVKTPFTAGYQPPQELPGVFVQAQMVSQILSAVLDNRPLLRWLPWWGDVLWVWVWSLVGGLMTWQMRSLRIRPQKRLLYIGLAGGLLLIILHQVSLAFLTQGIWMPLVPSAIAIMLAIAMIIAGDSSIKLHQKQKI